MTDGEGVGRVRKEGVGREIVKAKTSTIPGWESCPGVRPLPSPRSAVRGVGGWRGGSVRDTEIIDNSGGGGGENQKLEGSENSSFKSALCNMRKGKRMWEGKRYGRGWGEG